MTSWYLSNHPESHFVNGLMAARADEGRRFALRGREITVHRLGGVSERRVLDSPSQLAVALSDDFLLDLSDLPGLTRHSPACGGQAVRCASSPASSPSRLVPFRVREVSSAAVRT